MVQAANDEPDAFSRLLLPRVDQTWLATVTPMLYRLPFPSGYFGRLDDFERNVLKARSTLSPSRRSYSPLLGALNNHDRTGPDADAVQAVKLAPADLHARLVPLPRHQRAACEARPAALLLQPQVHGNPGPKLSTATATALRLLIDTPSLRYATHRLSYVGDTILNLMLTSMLQQQRGADKLADWSARANHMRSNQYLKHLAVHVFHMESLVLVVRF